MEDLPGVLGVGAGDLQLLLGQTVAVLLSQEVSLLEHLGRVGQVSPVLCSGVELQEVARWCQSPWDGGTALEELDGVRDGDHAVEIIVSTGYLASSPLYRRYTPRRVKDQMGNTDPAGDLTVQKPTALLGLFWY